MVQQEWIDAHDFMQADVIRWTEAVFDRKGRAKKSLRIGERSVIAEVLEADAQWVRLLVRHCAITRDDQLGRTVPTCKPEAEIKRAKKTILRGKVERLRWDDESARAAVIAGKRLETSRFVSVPA